MTKRRIAILISLLFAAPAAVVALEQATSRESAEAMAQTAPETVVYVEPAPASEQVVAVEQQPAPIEQQPAAIERPIATNPVSRFLHNIRQTAMSDTFPEGSMYGDYHWKPLPGQAQYFANLEQQRSTLIARSEGWPMGSSEGEHFHRSPLPAQMAYFERMDQQRFASAQPQPVARVEVTPASSEQSAQAGSAEIAIADTSPIR